MVLCRRPLSQPRSLLFLTSYKRVQGNGDPHTKAVGLNRRKPWTADPISSPTFSAIRLVNPFHHDPPFRLPREESNSWRIGDEDFGWRGGGWTQLTRTEELSIPLMEPLQKVRRGSPKALAGARFRPERHTLPPKRSYSPT